MTFSYSSRGFTLIELLVVISIVALMSSIVFAALSTARNKGANSGVVQNMSGIHAEGDLQYNEVGCYATTGTACSASVPAATTGACPITGSTIFADPTMVRQILAARNNGGGLASCGSNAGGSEWAVVVQLKTDAALAWCVDSRGARKQEGTPGGTALNQTSINAFITASSRCL